MTTCNFVNPVNLGNEEIFDWEFSGVECEGFATPELYEAIGSPGDGTGFYVEKVYSYGDALMSWMIFLFLTFSLAVITIKFIWGGK